MKKMFNVVLLVLVISLYSCENDENKGVSNSVTSAGVISGTISNYYVSKVDSIVFNQDLVGIVSSEGKFHCDLGIPKLSDLEIDFPDDVTVSDPNAKTKVLEYVPYFKGLPINMMKTNMNVNMTTLDGLAISMFIYCDREVTMKGSEDSDKEGFKGMLKYDLTLKKGWNEMVFKVEKYSFLTGEVQMNVSTIIPKDLKWMIIDKLSSPLPSKISKLKRMMLAK